MRSLALALILAQATGQPEPGSFEEWLRRGDQLRTSSKAAEARDAFERAAAMARTEGELADALAGRALAQLDLGDKEAAQRDAYDAVASSHSSVPARRALSSVAMKLADYDTASVHAEVLVELQPDDGDARALLAAAYLELDRNLEAWEQAQAARRLGADRAWFARVESRAQRDAWISRGWWAVAAMAAFLGLGLVGLYALGSILSSREVEKLTHTQLSHLHAEETPSERTAGRLYNAVLWFGTAFFYVSIPMMVVLSVVCGGVLLFAVLKLPRAPIQLFIGSLLIAVGGAWAVVRSLFLPPPKEPDGRALTAAEEPRLFELLQEVSAVATSRMVDRVVLEMDTAIGVREAGGTLQVLRGHGERVLHIGYAALPGLTVSELKAILAHEYGHFSHGETRLTPIISRTTQSMLRMVKRMTALGASVVLLSPVFWFLRIFMAIYLRVTAAHSRRRELLADRAAALAYGGDTFGRALQRYVELSDTFERSAFDILVAFREAGHDCADVYRCVVAAHEVVPPRLRELRAKENIHRLVSELDSHPPPYERIARVAGIPARQGLEVESAATVFRDHHAVARELTAELVRRIDALMAERKMPRLPASSPPPEDEPSLAAAVSLHGAALELRVRREPSAEEVLKESVQRLERVAGMSDPMLVEPLLELSRTQAKRGDRTDAARTLQRALDLLEGRGQFAQQRAVEIREMLKSLQVA